MQSLFEIIEKIDYSQKSRSERAELIKFFVDNLWNKDLKHFPAKMIAIKLSHIPTKDLYYMKSIFTDTMKRRGVDSANKEFWWSLKVK